MLRAGQYGFVRRGTMSADLERRVPREGHLFGDVVRVRRLALKMTQQQLAEATGMVVTTSSISKIENGKEVRLSRPRLIALAHALELPVGYLWKASGYPGASLRDMETEAALAEVPLAGDFIIRTVSRWAQTQDEPTLRTMPVEQQLRLAAAWAEREWGVKPAVAH